ncbi:MAG: hypothetical protein JO157_18045 [Acetobacteraceae bacterium]|nr:hypothetical protein [Acetobacteraceae bacterium]
MRKLVAAALVAMLAGAAMTARAAETVIIDNHHGPSPHQAYERGRMEAYRHAYVRHEIRHDHPVVVVH